MNTIKIEPTKSDRLVNGWPFCAIYIYYECMHFLLSNVLFIKCLSLPAFTLFFVSALSVCVTIQWVSKLTKLLEQELYGKDSKSR